jgi:hypothetical protein
MERPEPVTVEVDEEDLAPLAAQIPKAEGLAPGTRVVVYGSKSKRGLGRLLPLRKTVPPQVIGSALLALGYVNIRAEMEKERQGTSGEAPAVFAVR